MTSRNRTSKFVTVNRKLSPAERNDIKSLIVKPGKIGGYVRSAGRSQVWKYYGELLFQPSNAESSETVVSVDDQRHYCSDNKIAINQMRHRDRRSGQQLIRQERIWVISGPNR